MTSFEYIEKMIELTHKKKEALCYLTELLDQHKDRHDTAYKQWYFNRKHKIEQAILKVDVEFLDAYHQVLKIEGVNAIGDLPKKEFSIIKSLQEAISETKTLEEAIKSSEERLLEMNASADNSFHEKPSKHTAPRAIEAYKKFKK